MIRGKSLPARRGATRRRRRNTQDAPYLAWLRTQPCVACIKHPQTSITEAAHAGDRGTGQKCPDSQAIPLCSQHHRTGSKAHHVIGKSFWDFHGLNRELVLAELAARYEASNEMSPAAALVLNEPEDIYAPVEWTTE